MLFSFKQNQGLSRWILYGKRPLCSQGHKSYAFSDESKYDDDDDYVHADDDDDEKLRHIDVSLRIGGSKPQRNRRMTCAGQQTAIRSRLPQMNCIRDRPVEQTGGHNNCHQHRMCDISKKTAQNYCNCFLCPHEGMCTCACVRADN